MSELNKLVGKGKKVKLGELEIEIKPLTVNSMPLLMELGIEDSEKQGKAITELIKRTLKDSIPDATDEEIEKVPLGHMNILMETIMEVNQLDRGEGEKALIDKLKK